MAKEEGGGEAEIPVEFAVEVEVVYMFKSNLKQG